MSRARVGRENRGVEDRQAGQCLETTVMKAKTVVAVIGVTLLAAACATTTDAPVKGRASGSRRSRRRGIPVQTLPRRRAPEDHGSGPQGAVSE
jgi:hypothetical protein